MEHFVPGKEEYECSTLGFGMRFSLENKVKEITGKNSTSFLSEGIKKMLVCFIHTVDPGMCRHCRSNVNRDTLRLLKLRVTFVVT